MEFRKDINGLRAWAVIAVVIYHFDSRFLPGGFAGVDVFFVISGFLMTSIIFTAIDTNTFSLTKFYRARALRIIPALAFLCLVLLILGPLFLSPDDYKSLGKHAAGSISFLSNFIFWQEAGYFDASSKEKWLLHTWSLAVEWQFYVLYPILIISLRRFFSLSQTKFVIVGLTILSLSYSAVASQFWPSSSYYLLSTRAWELMFGGIAFLYPMHVKTSTKSKLELLGFVMIFISYFAISEDNYWPGYLALCPVVGAFLIIQARQANSILNNSFIIQKIGTWSYSIYLWHWPIVVLFFYFSLSSIFTLAGIVLSLALGYLSHHFIERKNFNTNISSPIDFIYFKPLLMSIAVIVVGAVVFVNAGFSELRNKQYQSLIAGAVSSPMREKCHKHSYAAPSESCTYFGNNISWAVFGDSHATELSYSMAKRLEPEQVGVKHMSFSGCATSYKISHTVDDCTRWYNDAVAYLLSSDNITNIVVNHRFTRQLLGGDGSDYPELVNEPMTAQSKERLLNFEKMIKLLSSQKDNIFVVYPFPELPRHVGQLISRENLFGSDISNVRGTSLQWYTERNQKIIEHFKNTKYPDNVHFIDATSIFCDEIFCYAVRNNETLYFDSNHPSTIATDKIVKLITLD
ncbi:acyltransferase [Glaciecola sp. MH2013]|uniref:acyltransferase family protein n=1 Tax=Glaciecola sp. MH2013 TaxID=2785524 RepID=UPI0018A01021|nr:acyltransferase family protein [Glaciecola sp. MH2013]MBF7072165.1 acyltransferase [Glaciecola sp. MH2013]